MSSVLVVGGTSGIGREIARHYAEAGDRVALTGRDVGRAAAVAKEIGGDTTGIAFDLTEPHGIAPALAGIKSVDSLVLAAIDRDVNTVGGYDIDVAIRLVTLKLVGYTEVVHALRSRLAPDAAIVMFGGGAVVRPYPGSTTVSTVNGGVIGLMNTLIVELAPIRVNVIHPGIVGDSPHWRDRDLSGFVARTPSGRLAQIADIVDAVAFLLRNPAVNGVSLDVDGGRCSAEHFSPVTTAH
jgi:NAD(P)-dependent dehydrogenase (short-subunit alcohol dehydrogenase family)